MILAGDWANESNMDDVALHFYGYNYKDPFYKEYANLEYTKKISNPNDKRQRITDFLKTTPDSVFSPSFRQLLISIHEKAIKP